MRILFIGDIVGSPAAIWSGAASRRSSTTIRSISSIANAENAAAGFGITREIGDQLLEWGVDVMTSGNHIWDKKEAIDYIGAEPRLLRPANFPAGVPGNGSYLARTADGRHGRRHQRDGPRLHAATSTIRSPSCCARSKRCAQRARVIFVDFHAEATSEKVAMGWHLDGKVTAVVGTHTHVQTADERILPKGTAYLTDVGMTGPHDSIIGVEIEPALGRFLNGMPARFETATGESAVERRHRRSRRADGARHRPSSTGPDRRGGLVVADAVVVAVAEPAVDAVAPAAHAAVVEHAQVWTSPAPIATAVRPAPRSTGPDRPAPRCRRSCRVLP